MIEDQLLTALECNEFYDFLIGKNNYKIEMNQWVSANVPTDVSRALTEGVYKVYKSHPELEIETKFFDQLTIMLKSDVFDVYIALSYIFSQILKESYSVAPFKIETETLDLLRISLVEHEEELKGYKEWQGLDNVEGMWDDVKRIDNIIYQKKGYKIIE